MYFGCGIIGDGYGWVNVFGYLIVSFCLVLILLKLIEVWVCELLGVIILKMCGFVFYDDDFIGYYEIVCFKLEKWVRVLLFGVLLFIYKGFLGFVLMNVS